jgi:hypothetical protein
VEGAEKSFVGKAACQEAKGICSLFLLTRDLIYFVQRVEEKVDLVEGSADN